MAFQKNKNNFPNPRTENPVGVFSDSQIWHTGPPCGAGFLSACSWSRTSEVHKAPSDGKATDSVAPDLLWFLWPASP